MARLLGLIQSSPEVLAGIGAHVGKFPGQEECLGVGQMLQHIALRQKIVRAVFTQDAVCQVIQEAQEEATSGVRISAGQVGGGKSVTGPEKEGA